jgi:hypothetical protein
VDQHQNVLNTMAFYGPSTSIITSAITAFAKEVHPEEIFQHFMKNS